MTVYIVTWNINKDKPNYGAERKKFIEGIDKYQNTYDSGLESVRFVSTTENAYTISDNLRKNLDNNDRLFVSKLNAGEHQGWLHTSTWEWINARV